MKLMESFTLVIIYNFGKFEGRWRKERFSYRLLQTFMRLWRIFVFYICQRTDPMLVYPGYFILP